MPFYTFHPLWPKRCPPGILFFINFAKRAAAAAAEAAAAAQVLF
jgi:hypothetical protein